MADIDNYQDVLDIRDIIERYEELEEMDDRDADDTAEFKTLKKLLIELEGNGGDHDWRDNWYPVTLIRESYREDYAREYADEQGLDLDTWPYTCIDWDEAVSELFDYDYSYVDYDGIDYYYR